MQQFVQTYVSFIDDLIKLYGSKSRDKLRKQKMWILQNTKNGNPEVLRLFFQNINNYRDRIAAEDESLFTGPGFLRLGRINFERLGQLKKWGSITETDRQTIWKYLNTLIVTASLSLQQSMDDVKDFLENLQKQNQVGNQVGKRKSPQAMDNIMHMMETPDMQRMTSLLEKKLQERGDLDLSNPTELFSKVISGQIDLSDLQNELQLEIAREVESGNISQNNLANMEQQIGSMMQDPDIMAKMTQVQSMMGAAGGLANFANLANMF